MADAAILKIVFGYITAQNMLYMLCHIMLLKRNLEGRGRIIRKT